MSSKELRQPKISGAWVALRILLSAEMLAAIALVALTIGPVLTDTASTLGQRASVLIVVICAAAWVGTTLYGAMTSRAAWVRGSALTLHLLLAAAAAGLFQGIFGEVTLLAWVLLLSAIVGVAASVVARPSQPDGI